MRKWLAMICCALVFCLTVVRPVSVSAMMPKSEAEAMAEELKRLDAEGKGAGTYRVTLQYLDGDKVTEKTIAMTIRGKNTVVDGVLAIDAKDISVTGEQVVSATAEDWIAWSEAKAWRIDDLAAVALVDLDAGAIKPVIGTYVLVVSAEGGVQTRAAVHVTSNAVLDDDYNKNKQAGYWYTDTFDANPLDFSAFNVWFGITIKAFLGILLVVPLILLLVHYVATTKIAKQVAFLLKSRQGDSLD
ncbi:hypothetical protein [Culicoidibacter larvae]|uniref:Uncharacterized protein n=1 Tax=Culicoidibacter larvae TaxID=2579976 RepID=A0A5R8Q8F8_9FIRM|nr:hypothetical protein [Culicoidibacter larvae]TLG71094.1 hypothetical protein FEZ08_11580 [Culicoidibacter larvae]